MYILRKRALTVSFQVGTYRGTRLRIYSQNSFRASSSDHYGSWLQSSSCYATVPHFRRFVPGPKVGTLDSWAHNFRFNRLD